jgi:hypothetical protein
MKRALLLSMIHTSEMMEEDKHIGSFHDEDDD